MSCHNDNHATILREKQLNIHTDEHQNLKIFWIWIATVSTVVNIVFLV